MGRPDAGVLVIDELAALDLRPLDVLGAGMEGTVVRLEGDLVAKVWNTRTAAELAVLQSFYAAVGESLTLRCPRILDVVRVGDRWASVEPLLRGEPMGAVPTDGSVRAVADVLEAVSGVAPSPVLGNLDALPGEPPLDLSAGFATGLAGLVERRASAVLARAVPGLDVMVAAVTARLRGLPPAPATLVHGDLIPANVLLDDAGAPAAVLDFGFLTTVGDPAFDRAVTASIFDMYGPDARATESRLDEALGERFGDDPDRLGVYRAAYAVVTATCFSASGSDGHFAWCAAMLRRPDVLAALG